MKNINVLGSVLAGVTGVVVGASLAVAGTLALKDGKSRSKLKGLFLKTKVEIEDSKKAALTN